MQQKNIPNPGFADDDGSADPRLAAALAAWAEDPAAEPALLAALAPARLMVPIVALLGEVETGPDGLKHEKTSDMAVPVIEAADGRRALPAFTSLETMARWRADARPAPVAAPQAAMVAFSERADTLLVDPAGPVSYRLDGARLRALAENRPYLPPVEDPEVRGAVCALLAAEPAVVEAHLRAADGVDGVLALLLEPETAYGDGARAFFERLAGALAGDPLLRVRMDQGLQVAMLAPGTALAGEPLYRR